MGTVNWDSYSVTEKLLTNKGMTFQEEQERNLEILRKARPDLEEQAPGLFDLVPQAPQTGVQQPPTPYARQGGQSSFAQPRPDSVSPQAGQPGPLVAPSRPAAGPEQAHLPAQGVAPGVDTAPIAPMPGTAPVRGATPSQPQAQEMPQAPGEVVNTAFENLARGAKGGRVTTLQENLIDLGYDVGGVDGIFGGGVQRGLKKFQKDFGLPETGIYDRAAAEAMAGAPEVIGQQQDPRGEHNEYTKGYQGGKGGDEFSVGGFVKYLGRKEGTDEHNGPENQLTLGYGILPATARAYGVNYKDYNSGATLKDRTAFAEAVYGKMHASAVEDFPTVFNNPEISDEYKIAALSLYINTGTLYDSTVRAFEEGDMDKVGASLAGIIHYPNKATGVWQNSLGLSKRRAEEYNEMLGENRVVEVRRSGNTYTWIDGAGKVVQTKTGTGTPDNDRTSIAVPKIEEVESAGPSGPRFIAGTDQWPQEKGSDEGSDDGSSQMQMVAEEDNSTLSTYTVQGGDAFSRIARSYGLSTEELHQMNPQISDPHQIFVGTELNVPEGGEGEGGGGGGGKVKLPQAKQLGMIGGVRDANRVWQSFGSSGMAHSSDYRDYSQLFREYTTTKKKGYYEVGKTADGQTVYAAPDYHKDKDGNYLGVSKDDAVRLAEEYGSLIPQRDWVKRLYGGALRLRMPTQPIYKTGGEGDSTKYTAAINAAIKKNKKYKKGALIVHGKEFFVSR